MATIREKQFTISESGISPRQVQDVGLQGEHNATELIFTIDSALRTKLDEIASERQGTLYYRLQAVDGAGAFHSSELLTVDGESGSTYVITYDVPNDLTASGGLLTINIVISLIVGGENDVTEEITLYSFPCRMRFVTTEGSGDSETLYKQDITGALVQAKHYRDEAEDFRDEAETFAQTSQSSATAASNSAQSAANSATAAGNSKTAAQTAETNARGYATTAEQAKDLASGYKDDAESSATSAATYASSASQSATSASESASFAGTYKELARGYQQYAKGYADAASDSASAAESAAASIAPLIIEREGTNITKGIVSFTVPQLTNGDLADIVEAVEDGKSVYLKTENSDIYYLVSYVNPSSGGANYVTALGEYWSVHYHISGGGTSENAYVSATLIRETTVDQTYNGSSTHAQSGTAVKQAISTKADQSTTYTKTETDNLISNKFVVITCDMTTYDGSSIPDISFANAKDIVDGIKAKKCVYIKQRNADIYYTVDYANDRGDNEYRLQISMDDKTVFYEVDEYYRGVAVTKVDQTFNALSGNAQSGVAVAQAIASVPVVTVEDVYNPDSHNAQSGRAVQGKLSTMPNYQTKTTVDNVLMPNTKYVLGEQSTLTLSMPTTGISLGNTIEVIFSSGATACTLTCDLTGFDFVPQANKTNKIVFEYIATDKWTVDVKESA